MEPLCWLRDHSLPSHPLAIPPLLGWTSTRAYPWLLTVPLTQQEVVLEHSSAFPNLIPFFVFCVCFIYFS